VIAQTPEPPYYAVIFTSVKTAADAAGYAEAMAAMLALAPRQPGFLGLESAREQIGITVSYWTDLDAIAAWKRNSEHLAVQHDARDRWYSSYTTRIARVERAYSFSR
jgi:heme-degrading monooxygenase HmoA